MNKDPIIFLMANLGSEATRLWRARDEGNSARARGAYERASGIVKEIQVLMDVESGQRELAIFQEVLDDAVCKKPKLRISSESVRRYFMPFASRLLSV
ncbi:hypothetical protein KGQ31_03205 [Patescibacteria group bacterium]|nr:hypothetical protein [Patescibacteria group bacterium]